MKIGKFITALIICAISVVSFSACKPVPQAENLVVNGTFATYTDGSPVIGDFKDIRWQKNDATPAKYVSVEKTYVDRCPAPVYENTQYKGDRWSNTFPEGWKIETSNPAVASFAGFEYSAKSDIDNKKMNAATFIVDVTAGATGWIRMYQKIKVNPNTNYRVTFQYGGKMVKPVNKTTGYIGLNVGFLEDPSFVDPNALNQTQNTTVDSNDIPAFVSGKDFVFNTGNLRHVTLCIGIGAPGYEIGDSRIDIRDIRMVEEVAEVSGSVHTLYRNNGYKDSNVLPVIIAIAAFIGLILLCWFITYSVNRNYEYNKPKDEDGANDGKPQGSKGKPQGGGKSQGGKPKGGKKAFLTADEGDSMEIPVNAEGNAVSEGQEKTVKEDAAADISETQSETAAVKAEAPAAVNADKEEAEEIKPAEKYSDDGFDDGGNKAAESNEPAAEKAAKKEKPPKEKKEPGAFGKFVSTAWNKFPFLILIGFALIIRIVCIFVFKGYRPDMTAALAAIKSVIENGSKYYSTTGTMNYAPGQLYIFYYIGLFIDWFKLAEGSIGTAFFMKLPALIADLGIGYLIYGFTKKFINKKSALGISALYLFNPAILFAFSIWGGTEAVYIFFIIFTFRYLLDRKYLKMCFAYAGAVLFSQHALTIAPLVLVFLIAAFFKAVHAYLNRSQIERKASEGLMALPKYSAIWKAPAGILIFFVSLIILCLPFTVSGVETGVSFKLFNYMAVYKELSVNFTKYTVNAFNVAGFMNRNDQAYAEQPVGIMTAMYLVMCMILAAVYVMKRNRANLTLLAAFLYFIVAYFMANAQPLYAVPGLIILLLACAAIGDRRLFGQYFILSGVSLLNISAVMISKQYMNNLPAYLLDTATNPNYAGTNLSKGLMLFGSILAILSFLYFMYIAMDITVANKRKVFMPFDKENPHYAFDTFRSIFW